MTATPVSSKRLRINWILASTGLSGGIRTTRQLAEAMSRRGHDVMIAYRSYHAWPPPWRIKTMWTRLKEERERRLDPDPHHLEGAAVALHPVRRREMRAEDVPDADVTIGTFWNTMEWIREWPSSKGLQAHYVQGYEVYTGFEDRVRAAYRLPTLKLVVSTWLQRIMAEEFGDPDSVLVPNGLDWEQFDSPPRAKATKPTVGLVYSPKDWEGCDVGLEALKIVQREIPELRIVSFGVDRMPTEGFDDVEAHLIPDQSKLPSYYRACDCWLLPSRSEGFGLPGLEAAASHCPVVSTRCGGPEDIVDDGETGYLVDVDDAEAMAARMIDVLRLPDDRWRAMSEASYRLARTFDWDDTAARLETALMAAVERRERPAPAARSA